MPIPIPNKPINNMGRYQKSNDWSGSPILATIASDTYAMQSMIPIRVITLPDIKAPYDNFDLFISGISVWVYM